VLLVDRAWFPRDKVCSDFVGPLALESKVDVVSRELARATVLGLDDEQWALLLRTMEALEANVARAAASGEAILLQHRFDRCDRDGDCAATVGAVDAGAGVVERADRGRCRVAEQVVAADADERVVGVDRGKKCGRRGVG
jgi:hypothetical protein